MTSFAFDCGVWRFPKREKGERRALLKEEGFSKPFHLLAALQKFDSSPSL